MSRLINGYVFEGIEVDHFQVTGTGVQYGKFHDRSYILLNEHHNMITQRTKPKLSLIKTSAHGNELWLDAPNMTTLKIDTQMDTSANEVVDFQVWGQDVKGTFVYPHIHILAHLTGEFN